MAENKDNLIGAVEDFLKKKKDEAGEEKKGRLTSQEVWKEEYEKLRKEGQY
jgi:hypothetical protein